MSTAMKGAEIVAGYQQLIAQAHRARLRVIGGTILPCQGSFYHAVDGEAKRQAVNDWIRSQSTFDGVVDFDAVVRNPANPATYLPAYDSGDHLHPNDAGYAAMGNAIKLGCLSLGDATRTPDSSRRDCTNPPAGETVYDTTVSEGAGGIVPATLTLTLGPPVSFGTFVPGEDRTEGSRRCRPSPAQR
jgi:hypothetical protein